jgi:hypothetical protein
MVLAELEVFSPSPAAKYRPIGSSFERLRSHSSTTGKLANKYTVEMMNYYISLFYSVSYHRTGRPWLTNFLTKMADL